MAHEHCSGKVDFGNSGRSRPAQREDAFCREQTLYLKPCKNWVKGENGIDSWVRMT